MTNDFAVVDQQQTRKSPLWPTVGAIGGGIAGYAIANRKGAKSYNDLIKEVKDTTDFSTKEDPDMWKSVKEKLAEVEKLEKELANASEAKLDPNSQVAKDLERVEKEAKEWIDAEQARVDKVSGNTGRRVKEFPTKEAVKKMEMGEEERKLLYDYCDKYETARKNIFAKDGAVDLLINGDGTGSNPKGVKKLKKEISDFYSTLPAHKKNAAIKDEYSKQIAAEVEKFLPKSFDASKITSYDMLKECQALYGEDLFSISDSFVRGAKPLEVSPGKRVYVTVNNDVLKSKRNSFREQLIDNIGNYIEKDAELKGFDEKFLKDNKAALELNLKPSITTVSDITTLTTKGKEARELLVKLDGLEHRIKTGEIKLGSPESFIMVSGTKIDIADQAALDTLKRDNVYLRDIATQYTKEKAKIQVARDSVIRSDARVTHLQRKIKATVQNDEGVKKVLDSIEFLNRETAPEEQKAAYRRLKAMINVEEASGSTERITEDKLPEGLKKRLEAIRNEYAEAAKKDGKVNEEAKKAAEDALTKGKADLEEAGKKLAEKFGKTGKKGKIIGTVIGIAAGAGLLRLIAPKKPKNA